MQSAATSTYRRTRLAVTGVALAVLASLAVVVPVAIPLAVVAAVCVVELTWWPASRPWLPGLTASAGAVSVLATIGHLLLGWPGVPSWGLFEVVLLSVLAGAVARWAPAGLAAPAGAVAGIAVAVTVLRAEPSSGAAQLSALEGVYVAAFWALGPITMAAIGLFGRQLEARHGRAVAEARRSQRLELARDLHDFVAHDISAMIAQAQAGQLMTSADGPVGIALGKIEAAGQAAMASMDRTVRILGDAAEAPDTAAALDSADHSEAPAGPGLDDLPQLVERFDAAGLTRVRLDVEDGLAELMPREIESTMYRVVVEALTNVRRHAPAARLVEIAVRGGDGAVDVAVTNDDGGSSSGGGSIRRGGVGLPSLAERVEALSGRFHAGPCGDGWQVTASVPLTAAREAVR